MKDINILGIDLAKTIFHIVALNKDGEKILAKKLHREEFEDYILTNIPKNSLLVMEACGSCHYWSNKFMESGFTVKLLKPCDVKAFAKTRQKNDTNDALAIARAGKDPELKSVRIKNISQQEISWLHKRRQHIIRQRVQYSNGLMSDLLEFGYYIKMSKSKFAREALNIVEDAKNAGVISERMYKEMKVIAEEIATLLIQESAIDKQLIAINKESETATLLKTIPGIGEINANILSIAAYENYDDCRSFAASLGLVPKQNSTGGKTSLGSITKKGDRYVRTMLIQGARSIAIRAKIQKDPTDHLVLWAKKLLGRMSFNKAAVAIANKLARIAYVCVTRKCAYA
ncbi:IS110 family transposase [Candidatus Tisiphia endosymbiont of Nedyus quadrimaculatus]|uniref:IS110 family transposase n=1 Tax=Candidatus Tisiphia endosymbiont of Nedyus quadrimaculatus TaxID=3139332 RepID=UPI00345F001A